MAESIRELIVQNLVDALKTVTGVKKVLRVEIPATEMKQYPVLLVAPGTETIVNETQGQYRRNWNLFIAGFVIQPTKSKPIDEAVNELLALVQAKVMQTRQRGGNAIDTELRTTDFFIDEGNRPMGGFQLGIEVIYRTSITDPCSPG